MKSRILSLAAVAGLLVATGCSGGGAGSATSGLTPTTKIPGTITTNAGAKGASFSMSFLMPASAVLGTTSTGRHTAYISPGSSGVQILLNPLVAGPGTFAVGTAAQPFGLSLSPGTYPTTAGAYGTNTTTPATTFPTGTAQMTSAYTAQAGPFTAVTLTTLPASATITPAAGQPFTITSAAASVAMVVNSVTGTQASGLFINATETAPSTPALYPFPVGSTMTFGNSPAIVGSTFTYSITPAAGSVAAGYYQVTFTFNNMIGGQNYVAGVVMTDITNANNAILSENQTGVQAVVLVGPTVFPTLTLKPVVAGVFIPTPVANAVYANGASPNSFETTVFATDARGFVIQNQNGPVVADNTPTIKVTSDPVGNLTLKSFGLAYGNVGFPNTSITAPNTVAATAVLTTLNTLTIATGSVSPNYPNVFGTLYTNALAPLNTQPLALTLSASAATNANGVGNPLNLTCVVSAASNGLGVTLASTTPTTVAGYTYTPGTNLPATAATLLVTGVSSSIPTAGTSGVNCQPSIALPIN